MKMKGEGFWVYTPDGRLYWGYVLRSGSRWKAFGGNGPSCYGDTKESAKEEFRRLKVEGKIKKHDQR